MKRIFSACLALAVFGQVLSKAAVCILPWGDVTTAPIVSNITYLLPDAVSTNGNQITSLDRLKFTNDSTGTVTFSNLVVGGYTATLGGNYTITPIHFAVTNAVGTYYVKDLTGITIAPGVTSAYSMVASDARYLGTNYTNTFQAGSANLTNWSGLSTNAVAYLNQLSALSNAAFASLAAQSNWVGASFQPASGNLTNWSGLSTNAVAYLNQLAAQSNWTVGTFQPASANLTNWSGLGTNAFVRTNESRPVTLTNQANIFSGNGAGLTSLNVGAMAQQSTNAPQFNNATNYGNLTIGTNTAFPIGGITLQSDNGSGQNGITLGNAGYISGNGTHGPGLGQNELGIATFNRAAITWHVHQFSFLFGDAFQMGMPPHTNNATDGPAYLNGDMQDTAPGILGTSKSLNFHIRDTNGNDQVIALKARHTDMNGNSALIIYNPVPDEWALPQTSTYGTPQFEAWGDGLVLHGKYFEDYVASSPGTNFSIYFTDPKNSEVNISQTTTFSIVSNSTSFLTNQSAFRHLRIRPGPGTWTVVFPTNIIWGSESGTATAPTSATASNILDVTLEAAVANTATNYYGRYTIAPYSPVYDVNALMFFAAVTNAGGTISATEKAAVNALAVNMKLDGSWTNHDAIYPLIGGTTNSMRWNLKATNLYPLNFVGTLTANSFGITGDGSTGYFDTGFVPSTAGGIFTSAGASVSMYQRLAAPVGGFMGTLDFSGHQFEAFTNSAISAKWALHGSGFQFCAGLSTFKGFWCFTQFSGVAYGYAPNGPSSSANASPTGLSALSIYGLARNGQGSADNFGNMSFGFFAIGGGQSPTQEANFAADVNAFISALGRQ